MSTTNLPSLDLNARFTQLMSAACPELEDGMNFSIPLKKYAEGQKEGSRFLLKDGQWRLIRDGDSDIIHKCDRPVCIEDLTLFQIVCDSEAAQYILSQKWLHEIKTYGRVLSFDEAQRTHEPELPVPAL